MWKGVLGGHKTIRHTWAGALQLLLLLPLVAHLALLPGQHCFIACLVAPNLMHHCIQLLRGGGMA
jgi:hypothetical protein